jgi:hypothetical protein
MLAQDESEIKGQMYLDNYSVRVMNKVPVKEKYSDFNPKKPVYQDLIADGKAMKKRLNNLSKLVNPQVHIEQQ